MKIPQILQSNHFSTQDHERWAGALVSLAISVLLVFAKFFAYRVTGSHAVFSDALESVINIVSAMLALWAIWVASKPADQDHPYGHGKAEHFSAAFEGGAILFAGIFIVIESVWSLFEPVALRHLDLGLAIVFAAGAINLALGLYLKTLGRRLNSQALLASSAHVISDFWTSAGVLMGLVIVYFTGVYWLDPLIAMAVGLNLGWMGFKTLRRSGGVLMDEEDTNVIRALGKLFEKHIFPGIIRIHYTRVIRSGRFHHVDLHLVVPEFWSVERAHQESNRFEKKVIAEYPLEGELHFHLDPCRRAYCRVCDLPECPVRKYEFRSRIPFSLEELTSPTEPEEFGSGMFVR